jgi:hypothetical protein
MLYAQATRRMGFMDPAGPLRKMMVGDFERGRTGRCKVSALLTFREIPVFVAVIYFLHRMPCRCMWAQSAKRSLSCSRGLIPNLL